MPKFAHRNEGEEMTIRPDGFFRFIRLAASALGYRTLSTWPGNGDKIFLTSLKEYLMSSLIFTFMVAIFAGPGTCRFVDRLRSRSSGATGADSIRAEAYT